MDETKNETRTEEAAMPRGGRAAPAAKDTETKAAPAKNRAGRVPEKKKGVWVYIGPNLKGLVQSGSVYRGSREDALDALADAAKVVPEVKTLLVSGEALGAARRKIRKPGNMLYEAYRKAGRKTGKF